LKIISVYSNSTNSGKKSLAMTLGQQAAKADQHTLLIELDYYNNGIAQTYGITNSERNIEGYLKQVARNRDFNIGNFIMKKSHFEKQNKDLTKAHEGINSDLDFLIFSQEYRPSLFPHLDFESTEDVSRFSKRFIEELKQTDYDLIILVLPCDYEDMFTVPMILESDHTVNVIGFSLSRIDEMKRIARIFDNETLQKMHYVLNFTTKKIDVSDYEHLLKPLKLDQLVQYDDQRMLNEVNAEIGSPSMDQAAINLLKQCGFETPENKRSFFRR